MARIQCKNCGYRFEKRTGEIPKKCPYCSGENTMRLEENAEELLGESGGF